MAPKIVFVDDESNLLKLYGKMLQPEASNWDLMFFDDCRTAWEFLQVNPIDAVVADLIMPHISGADLLMRMRSLPATADVPVTILTGLCDAGLKRHALDLGATDLLNKPVQALDLISPIRSMLRLKAMGDALKQHNRDLEETVHRRTRQLQQSRLQIVWRLGKAAEFRDEETGEHVVRVGCYSRILAETLGLPPRFLDELFLAAPLHDIGKIGIPDAILLKPGRLDDAERHLMQSHCELGERILREPSLLELCAPPEISDSAASPLEGDSLMELARVIALSHHEHWDGRGYPYQLSGAEIPLAARIVGVADVYDALTSKRPYKAELAHDETVNIIVNVSGTQFDPDVVEALLQAQPAIIQVRHQIALSQGRADAANCSILQKPLLRKSQKASFPPARSVRDASKMTNLCEGGGGQHSKVIPLEPCTHYLNAILSRGPAG